MKIIAIDFDGTIVHHRFPQIGPPMLGAIDTIKQLMSMRNVKLILWTVRDGDYLKEAIEWCTRKGLVFDAINQSIDSISTSPKVYAHYYIDDSVAGAPYWRDGRLTYLDWEKVREDMEDRLGLEFESNIVS